MEVENSPSSARQLLNEFTKKDLEEEFYKNCEALDTKAQEIIRLEQKLLYLQSRFSRFSKEKAAIVPVKQKQTAFQLTPKELQDQITSLEQRIIQRQTHCDKLTNQVQYFRHMKKMKVTDTFFDLIEISNDLFHKKSLPNLLNQLRATSAILQNNYSGAEGPLRSLIDSIGESISLSESFKRKRAIREREAKVEELRSNLTELQQRYNKMEKKHQKVFDVYESVAAKNSKKSEKVGELQRKKETKQIEASKADQLEMAAENLKNDISKLKAQKIKLIEQNENHQEKMISSAQKEIEEARKEVEKLNEKCEKYEKKNEKLEKEIEKSQSKLSKAIKKRDQLDSQFKSVQKEYKESIDVFGKVMENSENDPFNDQRFLDYLAEMTKKNYLPEKIKSINDRIAEIDNKIEKINTKIDQHTQQQEEMDLIIETKRNTVKNLDEKLRQISEILETKENTEREKPPFEETIEIAKFEQDKIDTVADDENAILIFFKDFLLSPAFIGEKPSQIFLVVDFMESQSMTTPVDPNTGIFNESLFFVCPNDKILKEYLSKSVVPFQLCRSRDSKITETGQSELNLSPFIENRIKGFKSEAKIWSTSGKAVGKLTFEAILLKDIP